MEEASQSLGLSLKPAKCVSIVLLNGKTKKGASFELTQGKTKAISENPTKFLGKVLGSNQTQTRTNAGAQLKSKVEICIERIAKRPIRGEMKIWILRNYLMPALHFHLAVNPISTSTITTCENIKKWLHLPKNATRAIIHHPSLPSSTPTLSNFYMKAKLNYLSAISSSSDKSINELTFLTNDEEFLKRQNIPKKAGEHNLAKKHRKTVKAVLSEEERNKWNEKLQKLQVQNKTTETIDLEEENQVWKRIIDGLPAKQLSFILRACSDTLPTPVNLARWKIQLQSTCALCGSQGATVKHILNGCPIALQNGRYT